MILLQLPSYSLEMDLNFESTSIQQTRDDHDEMITNVCPITRGVLKVTVIIG
jgi:hypothetical protein